MSAEPTGPRFQELVTDVLAPLILGGSLRPVRPFGPSLALRIGEQSAVADSDLRSRIDVARVRRARLIAPVDVLPELDASEYALVAALNDLLQATNHEIGGLFTAGRYPRLIAGVLEICGHVGAPRTALEALSRHATFARVLELTRKDTNISWWTGKASFRGQEPPPRLLLWRGLRRVHVDEQRVDLVEMCHGFPGADESSFRDALGVWLTRSPLTDVGTATRRFPPFGWSTSTLSLIAATPGRTLAWRLLARRPAAEVVPVLERAAAEIPAAFTKERALAASFAAEVAEGFKELSSSSGAPRAHGGAAALIASDAAPAAETGKALPSARRATAPKAG